MEIVHPFELAGLGKAPFKFVGSYTDIGPKKWVENGVQCESGAPGQPMGACDFCGTGIAYCFQVKSSDGTTSVVGSSCVEKTFSKGTRVYTEVENVVRARKREQREKRALVKIEQAREWLTVPAIRGALSGRPHPSKHREALGDTLLDWCHWSLENAGTTGKLRVFSAIKHRIKAKGLEAPQS